MSTIRQIVQGSPMTVDQDGNLALAQQIMTWSDVRHLPVLKGDALVGVLSERDVLRRYAEVGRQAGGREPIRTVMSAPPVTIAPDDTVDDAIVLVTGRGIGCLPVVEAEHLIGIITRRDLLAERLDGGTEARAAEAAGAKSRDRVGTRLVVDDAMSRNPSTVSPNDTLRTAVDQMGRHGVRHLPVT